jgi:serine/threonine protein kinase/dienelactone hydrolase
MTQQPPSIKAIFGQAVEIASPGERQSYLDQVCADAPEIRQKVEALLKAYEQAGSFLANPAPNLDGTVDEPPITERPGTVIGPYKLMEQIGEGGMGLVFVAEQQHPVRRKVALKIIKPGMDSKQVIARFEAERQALAMMDHQNIAKVFDAGTTESGRPYFVMELVHGVPITEYCDANQLTPRQRLELFVSVCQAIQHAHQKGIIHRDIKPSNILVTMYDDKPVPKVIDFGVAKAIEQRLTEKTVYTQFGTLVGTIEYMSPEQAEMNAFGVDTRSDIYALGVLLYELLTGTTPLERPRLREAAFDEIRRIIKEEEPQRPSVRLSTSGALAKVAAARKTEPAKLSRLMRGELDWVVMRCLEKDRSRRYDTASGLARDVERFLKDEPVEARPPSTWYRACKLVRRHRAALAVAGVVAATIVVGTTVSLWQASLARADRERAEIAEAKRIEDQAIADAALVAERRQNALDRAIEAAFSGDLEKAHKTIVAAEAAGVAPDRVHWLHGLVHYQQGKLEEAIREFESSIALKPSVAAYAMHGQALFDASLQSGNSLTRYYQSARIDLVYSTPPETAEDYLCRGFTLGLFKGSHGLDVKRAQALDDIDKAIAMRDTPIARAMRAIEAHAIATEKRDLSLVERPLEDIQKTRLRLSDNKFVRYKSLHAHLWAANLYEMGGQPEKRKAVLEEAGRDLRELKDIPTRNYAMARVYYYEHIGHTADALKELEEASRRPETSDLVTWYALALYELGRDVEALRVLDERLKPGNSAGEILRIVLLAEQPDVGPEKAYDQYRKLKASQAGQPTGPRWNPYDLAVILLGKKKDAVGQAQSVAILSLFTKYMTGHASEAEFLEAAGKNPLLLCPAHYVIGLNRLSDGDRAGAREHFQKVLDTKFYPHNVYPYARAFLARLKRDPEWPKWIPVQGQPDTKPLIVSEKVSPIEVIHAATNDKRTTDAVVRKPPGQGPFPAMIYLHGGFRKQTVETLKKWSTEMPTATRFLAAGYVTIMATYQGLEEDPQDPRNLVDILTIVEQVKKMPEVDSKSVVVWGVSGGGSFALELAGETELSAIAVEEPATGMISGIFTKEAWAKLGEKPPFMGKSLRPILGEPERFITEEAKKQTHDKVMKVSCPVFYAHSDQVVFNKLNDLVLVPELKKMKPKLEMKQYPKLYHTFSTKHEPFFTDCDAFFKKHLGTQPTAIKLDTKGTESKR